MPACHALELSPQFLCLALRHGGRDPSVLADREDAPVFRAEQFDVDFGRHRMALDVSAKLIGAEIELVQQLLEDGRGRRFDVSHPVEPRRVVERDSGQPGISEFRRL